MSHAFFIKARTEPVDPGADRFGSGTRLVLYDAPSRAAAETWSKGYVQELLLDGHPEQKLSQFNVVSVYERLLTTADDEQIVWPSLVEQASASPAELGSSMMFESASASRLDDSEDDEIERLKKRVPDTKKNYNWNPKKQFYYVLYHAERAFIVRAMNMFLAPRPYIRAFAATPDATHRVRIATWPGARQCHK